MSKQCVLLQVFAVCGVLLLVAGASGAAIITRTVSMTHSQDPLLEPNGLAAGAVFTLDTANASELTIELANTSTGVPSGFDNSDQILTSISFDLGSPGQGPADAAITGGTVVVGPGSRSLNFERIETQLGPGDDASGEWGYGNSGGTELLTNIVSANQAHVVRLPGANLDGPPKGELNGPQGGLVADPPIVALGGLGAVAETVVINLSLDRPLADLAFLDNGVVAEFGSDAAFLVHTPEPTTLLLLIVGSLGALRRRRR